MNKYAVYGSDGLWIQDVHADNVEEAIKKVEGAVSAKVVAFGL